MEFGVAEAEDSAVGGDEPVAGTGDFVSEYRRTRYGRDATGRCDSHVDGPRRLGRRDGRDRGCRVDGIASGRRPTERGPVAPVKPVPVMMTAKPPAVDPRFGEREVTVGTAS